MPLQELLQQLLNLSGNKFTNSPFLKPLLFTTSPDKENHKTPLCVKSRPDAVNCHQEKTSLRLTIRIDDTDNPSYNDRYNKTVTLNPRANHISIPLNQLVTSEANRKLNLSKIKRVLLFLTQPKERRTLYLDNLRLE